MLLPFFISTYSTPSEAEANGECVVLLHGIFTTSIRMSRLHYTLHAAGYAVVSISYPSRDRSIEALADSIVPVVSGFDDRYHTVHLVGYSMGGLIARAYLARTDAVPVSRLVCIGTPNHGTRYVDSLRHQSWLQRAFATIGGPSGNELGSPEQIDSIVHTLGTQAPPGIETGVIAGDRGWAPFHLPRPHDGYVPVESTKLENMADRIIIHKSHQILPTSKTVGRETVQFLQTGRFSEEATRSV